MGKIKLGAWYYRRSTAELRDLLVIFDRIGATQFGDAVLDLILSR